MDYEKLGRYQHSLERFRRAMDARRSLLAELMRLLSEAVNQNGDEVPPFDQGKVVSLVAEIDELDREARQLAHAANSVAGVVGKSVIPFRQAME